MGTSLECIFLVTWKTSWHFWEEEAKKSLHHMQNNLGEKIRVKSPSNEFIRYMKMHWWIIAKMIGIMYLQTKRSNQSGVTQINQSNICKRLSKFMCYNLQLIYDMIWERERVGRIWIWEFGVMRLGLHAFMILLYRSS